MDLSDFQKKTDQTLAALKTELLGLRGNRPTSKLVEDIKVDYFGQPLPIKQLASISIVPPREINISVWDKNAVAGVVKAIEGSELGLTVNTDGNLIRLHLPPLSEERRQEITRIAKKTVEDFRIQIRNFRDEIIKDINNREKEGEITEDNKFKLKDDIQEIIDKTNKEMDKLLEDKIREINS